MVERGELPAYLDGSWEKKIFRNAKFCEETGQGFYRLVEAEREKESGDAPFWKGERPGQNFPAESYRRLMPHAPDADLSDYGNHYAECWARFGKRAVVELEALRKAGVDRPLERMAEQGLALSSVVTIDVDPGLHAIAYWFVTTAGMADVYARMKGFLRKDTPVRPWDVDGYSSGPARFKEVDGELVEIVVDRESDDGKFAIVRRLLIGRRIIRRQA
jgi:hypothetical protein